MAAPLRVPRSLVRTSRAEHTALPFSVVDGAIPNDLFGHLFIVAPASTFSPETPRTTVMAGDGIICRFDLDPSGVTLTSRLARTHDFVADAITNAHGDLSPFRFHSAGLLRIGLLGTRDFANTAFVPMKASASAPARMILTYDAGRPVEIDPRTLEVLGPVGGRDEWRPEALREATFPVYLSPAHPTFDRRTGELFTINYGRGISNFLGSVPLVYALTSMPKWVAVAFERIAVIGGFDVAYRWLLRRIERGTTRFDRALEHLLDTYLPDIPDTFTDLVRWDGSGRLERFRLVTPDEREVRITQSIHQIAVTRDHVIVLHTAFKIGFASAFNDPIPRSDAIDKLLHAALTRPQLPNTTFYIVPRAALDDPNLPSGDDGVRRVTCQRVTIPLETDHFLADYDDSGGLVTLHVAHSPATDLAEWLRPYDVSAWGGPVPADLHGMLAVGAMDVGRFGRYVVRAATGRVEEAKTILDEHRSWGISLYAGRGLNAEDELPERIDHLYWCTVGFYPELLTRFVYDLYEDYPHRIVPLSAIRAMAANGRPSCIVRVDTAGLRIGDAYELPDGVIAGSLQLVPKGGSWGSGTDGYLVGTVYTSARTELWIFDAADLSAGPICRLAASAFELGFSLHTAWLPSVASPASSYKITAEDELRSYVPAPLRRRFEQDLYPEFA